MRRHVTFSVCFVALVVIGGFALSLPAAPVLAAGGKNGPSDNDAASGSDAGNAPELALPLSNNKRTWNANLTPPGSDADWYRVDASGAFCAVVDATTSATGALTLAASASRDPAVAREIAPHTPLRLALAAPGGSSALLGLEPQMTAFSALEGAGGRTPPSPGRYTFAIGATPAAALPREEGDAGGNVATAAPLPPACSAGAIGGTDLADVYRTDVTDARLLGVSFAIASGTDARLRVVSPSAVTVATLASGDAVDVLADEPGRWTFVVEPASGAAHAAAGIVALPLASLADAGSATEYILGITDGPGEPQACRPSCLR